MALSTRAVKRLIVSLANRLVGQEVAKALNDSLAVSDATSHTVPTLIVATNVSATTNFGALAVGDRVIRVSPVAGSAEAYTIATAGTLPEAAIVGDFYIVFRAVPTVPAVSDVL